MQAVIIKQSHFSDLPGHTWNILLTEQNAPLLGHLTKEYPSLGEVGTINRGLITGDREKYFTREKKSKSYVAILSGSDVNRYHTSAPSEFVLFERPETAGGCWDSDMHLAPHKIVIRQIATRPIASLLETPIAVTGNIFTLRTGDLSQEKYLLGVINSSLVDFFWKIMFADFKTSFPQVTIASLAQIPIRTIDISDESDKSYQRRVVSLVDQMLDLQKRLPLAKTDHDKTLLERQIAATDKEIDALVYELYGLTEEEIRIVEGGQ